MKFYHGNDVWFDCNSDGVVSVEDIGGVLNDVCDIVSQPNVAMQHRRPNDFIFAFASGRNKNNGKPKNEREMKRVMKEERREKT